MSLITLAGVTFAYGTREIVRDANLALGGADRIGLIGANGSGKTTLLGLITGSIKPHHGSVVRKRHLAIGLLSQEVGTPPDLSVFQVAYGARPAAARLSARLEEVEALLAQGQADEALLDHYADLQRQAQELGLAGYQGQVASVLRSLGLAQEQLEQPASSLSGGEYTRVRLATVLLGDYDLLLLDEPTNHLDIQATEWLESFLLGCGKPFVVVSHDRFLLDRITNKTVEVEAGRVVSYAGSYHAYAAEKRRLQERQQQDYQRQQELLAKMRQFVDRWRAGTRARQAASRQKAMDRMALLERPWMRQVRPQVGFAAAARTPRTVFSLQEVAKGYGGRTLFSGLTLEVERGERIGLVGPNGSGKTTFMRLLTGEESPDQGQVAVAREMAVACFDQRLADLEEGSTVLEQLLAVADLPVPRARDLLGQFLFHGEDVFKPVAVLSGGERSRLMLARLVASRPSVLLLDEPTNHLDLFGREALEQALLGFQGTLIFTTHDRRFVDQLAQRVLVFGGERVEVRYGGYYAQSLEPAAAPAPEAPEPAEDLDWMRRPAPPLPRPRKRKERPATAPDPLPALEAEIAQAEQDFAGVEQRLADPATYHDGALVRELAREHVRLRRLLDALYQRWSELSA